MFQIGKGSIAALDGVVRSKVEQQGRRTGYRGSKNKYRGSTEEVPRETNRRNR